MVHSQKFRVVAVRANGKREVRVSNVSVSTAEAMQAADIQGGFFVRVLIERDVQATTAGDRAHWNNPDF